MKIKASRRDFIKTGAMAVAGLGLGSLPQYAVAEYDFEPLEALDFSLTPLPYAYNALEPHIDAKTMETHHSKHHAAYIKNLNEAIQKDEKCKTMSVEDLIKNTKKIQDNIQRAVRNNGGGHWNHTFFWQIIGPEKGTMPSEKLLKAINESFGSMDELKKQFEEKAKGVFGSGWAWVIANDGKLKVTSTPNQDNPLMDVADDQGKPILGVDVWEHAYYLKYQNRRPDYLSAFWNVVNWKRVSHLYEAS